MKKTFILTVLILAFGFMGFTSAYAGVYTFSPDPSNIWNLNHAAYYKWGFSWSLPVNEYITEASLQINHIDDSEVDLSNILYIHLLDDAPVGPIANNLWDTKAGDQFNEANPLTPKIAEYVDAGPGAENLTYNLSSLGLLDDLAAFSGNGNVGLGFDPDCYYVNKGVTFTITTKAVPEPATMSLLGMGVLGLLGLKRKKA